MSTFQRFKSTGGQQRLVTVLCVGVWLSFVVVPARAYVLEGIHWPSNEPIVLNLQLGTPTSPLSDGSTSWNQVAEAAASIWNPYLSSGVQFETQETNDTPKQDDGVNTVFFSPTVYGEKFGDDTLAITLYRYETSTDEATEADVLFNSNVAFDSYRGPLRYDDSLGGYRFDLRRVAIHEFGHVLGLDHVPQSADAIMTPVTTDIDTIQADDIAGVESIYGIASAEVPAINGGLSAGGVLGQLFEYRISATNEPKSFQASGLPPGFSLDANTGVLSGIPTVAGTYKVTVGAANSAGTGTAILTLFFQPTPVITSSTNVTAYVGYAYYYQIQASGLPTIFDASALPSGLMLDANTGLISGTPLTAGSYSVELRATNDVTTGSGTLNLTVANDATLTVLHRFMGLGTDGARPTGLVAGMDGNFYGTTSGGGSSNAGTFFNVTPDGTLTTILSFDPTGISAPASLLRAADGSFYGITDAANYAQVPTLYKLTVDGTLSTVYRFSGGSAGFPPSVTVLQGADGNYYGTISYLAYMQTGFEGSVYKLTPDGTLTILHQFNGTDGFYPLTLQQGSDGAFYGMTNEGGSANQGTVFKVTVDGIFTSLHTFQGQDGAFPVNGLTQGADGAFYGVTSEGGSATRGSIFKITTDGVFTTIHEFTDAEGTNPGGSLTLGSDGNFYGSSGLTGVGGAGVFAGTIFKVTPDGTLTTLHTFETAEGVPPFLPLVQGPDGNFLSASSAPGGVGSGMVFKITPGAVPVASVPPPVVTPTVTLEATIPQVDAGSGGEGMFTVTLSALQDHDVFVHYVVKGSAANGVDYVTLSGTKKIKARKTSRPIKVMPLGELGGAAKKTVVLTLSDGDGYTVGTTGKVKVKILAAEQ